mmetsp:Transcript_48274/g.105056  ORF Transcript_48274/g.105056 Transcript_48274/m.105056 type:complete len:203 (+) Transcript_48274:73-681(+)|eukprot:CAMPEP_0204274348 /NCGR_PEP_ID=MMETSP0468-20130131/25133_1 /ASSEMBLY_ACC=CAM_ASM_000383 /TAXON_ID=2969 /ORGANISM="Oxyrrhis marina" /LENGTH=202 /DNA_ID=CAMNT_0051250545 /DNA_START=65 /DNA_END=673 /DNA_ORIENTATION=+
MLSRVFCVLFCATCTAATVSTDPPEQDVKALLQRLETSLDAQPDPHQRLRMVDLVAKTKRLLKTQEHDKMVAEVVKARDEIESEDALVKGEEQEMNEALLQYVSSEKDAMMGLLEDIKQTHIRGREARRVAAQPVLALAGARPEVEPTVFTKTATLVGTPSAVASGGRLVGSHQTAAVAGLSLIGVLVCAAGVREYLKPAKG